METISINDDISNPCHSPVYDRRVIFTQNSTGVQFSVDIKLPPRSNGEAMILLHGYADFPYNSEVVDALTDINFAVFAITVRNYGLNMKSLETAFYPSESCTLEIYFLEIETVYKYIRDTFCHLSNIHLTGHSMGGLISTLFVMNKLHQYPLKTLTLNGPYMELKESSKFTELMYEVLANPSALMTRAMKEPYGMLNKPDYPKLSPDGKSYIYSSDYVNMLIRNGFDIGKKLGDFPFMFNNLVQYYTLGAAIVNGQGSFQGKHWRDDPISIHENRRIRLRTLCLSSISDTIVNHKESIYWSRQVFNSNYLTVCDETTLADQIPSDMMYTGCHNVVSSSVPVRKAFLEMYKTWLVSTPTPMPTPMPIPTPMPMPTPMPTPTPTPIPSIRSIFRADLNQVDDNDGKKAGGGPNIIIFQGRGDLTLAELGVLKYYAKNNMLDNLESVGGSSYGAILALLTILYKNNHIVAPFESVVQFYTKIVVPSAKTTSTAAFEEMIGSLLLTCGLSSTITFEDLYHATGVELTIPGTNVTYSECRVWNYRSNPKMYIREAIAINTIVVNYTNPYKYNEDYYIHGGYLNNFLLPWYMKREKRYLNSKNTVAILLIHEGVDSYTYNSSTGKIMNIRQPNLKLPEPSKVIMEKEINDNNWKNYILPIYISSSINNDDALIHLGYIETEKSLK